MVNLKWNGDDFRNPRDSSGATAGLISRSGDIQQGYRHGSLTEGLVAYYPLEEGSGSTAGDRTSMSNDASISGATWNSNPATGNYCLEFDGSDDYAEAPDSSSLDVTGDSITMSSWVFLNSVPSSNRDMILNKENEYEIAVGTSGNLQWAIRRNGNWSWINTGISVPTDAWVLVTVTYDGSSVRSYKNGALGDTYSLSGKIDSNGKPFTVGWRSSQGESPWNGKLDDVRVYERNLTDPEIEALYTLSKPSNVSPDDTLQ